MREKEKETERDRVRERERERQSERERERQSEGETHQLNVQFCFPRDSQVNLTKDAILLFTEGGEG